MLIQVYMKRCKYQYHFAQEGDNYNFSSRHGQLIDIIIIAVRRIRIRIMMRPAVALL